MTLPMIGKLLVHTQMQTTARYAHFFDEPLRVGLDQVCEMFCTPLRVVPADTAAQIAKFPSGIIPTGTSRVTPVLSRSGRLGPLRPANVHLACLYLGYRACGWSIRLESDAPTA